MHLNSKGNTPSWNANVGILEQIVLQLQNIREAMNEKDLIKSKDAAILFFDMSCIKTKELKPEFETLINRLETLENQILNLPEGPTKNALILNFKKILRELVRNTLFYLKELGLINLDFEKLTPVDEVDNDY